MQMHKNKHLAIEQTNKVSIIPLINPSILIISIILKSLNRQVFEPSLELVAFLDTGNEVLPILSSYFGVCDVNHISINVEIDV